LNHKLASDPRVEAVLLSVADGIPVLPQAVEMICRHSPEAFY